DIGRVKLPMMIRKYTGKDIKCEAVSGLDRIETPLSEYAMIIQCGGCVATAKQIHSRLKPALDMGIAVSNYGLAIAYMNGIFERVTAIFK
ncbi:MAG: [FeFe] hydrogenase H-cluster maturation GTPase HydF, partial [Bacteroidales bacterium]|nr:[FeFe] hydrogenase H-cluster maturation GTPase HydF [Bacteroidales bacterium]